MTHKIKWIDRGREPQCPPNPAFPNGTNTDISMGAQKACTIDLPYPAKRCGLYAIECEACGLTLAVTTAGRPDDPRSVRVACKRETTEH